MKKKGKKLYESGNTKQGYRYFQRALRVRRYMVINLVQVGLFLVQFIYIYMLIGVQELKRNCIKFLVAPYEGMLYICTHVCTY